MQFMKNLHEAIASSPISKIESRSISSMKPSFWYWIQVLENLSGLSPDDKFREETKKGAGRGMGKQNWEGVKKLRGDMVRGAVQAFCRTPQKTMREHRSQMSRVVTWKERPANGTFWTRRLQNAPANFRLRNARARPEPLLRREAQAP